MGTRSSHSEGGAPALTPLSSFKASKRQLPIADPASHSSVAGFVDKGSSFTMALVLARKMHVIIDESRGGNGDSHRQAYHHLPVQAAGLLRRAQDDVASARQP